MGGENSTDSVGTRAESSPAWASRCPAVAKAGAAPSREPRWVPPASCGVARLLPDAMFGSEMIELCFFLTRCNISSSQDLHIKHGAWIHTFACVLRTSHEYVIESIPMDWEAMPHANSTSKEPYKKIRSKKTDERLHFVSLSHTCATRARTRLEEEVGSMPRRVPRGWPARRAAPPAGPRRGERVRRGGQPGGPA